LIDKYSERPATYVISTHLIEEASDIIERVVILKEGKLILDEDTETVLAGGYAVSGSAGAVDEFCKGKQILGQDVLGGLKTAYIKGQVRRDEIPENLELSKPDLQKLFIQLTN
jgi:ABC-2 type transport system ATP-binding protein